MAVRLGHLVVNLDGTVQQVSVSSIATANIALQQRATNANPIYLGATSTLTSTNYGVRLPAPSGGVPAAPFMCEADNKNGVLWLNELYVLGTSGEFLHVLYLESL